MEQGVILVRFSEFSEAFKDAASSFYLTEQWKLVEDVEIPLGPKGLRHNFFSNLTNK